MKLSTIEMPFINLSYSPQQLKSPAFLGIATTNICDGIYIKELLSRNELVRTHDEWYRCIKEIEHFVG
jgi:hypothetical protein